jgi:4-amino-4-deoxy-L-arabinose transferase-like glycosyltransferase
MRRHVDKLLLGAACIIPFLRLGVGEIQPWDESLYVIRAEACLKFGAWLDQAQYAVGHLYSSTHPPLGVWLIAVSRHILGDTVFAIRFPVAFAAFGSILFGYLIIRKLGSNNAALVGAVSLASADLFLLLSHLARMECFILFFTLAATYFLITAIEQNSLLFIAMSGVLLAFGLLSKFAEAFFI